MSNGILYIKNMVCNRCKMVVKSTLEKEGIDVLSVDLGEVHVSTKIDQYKKRSLSKILEPLGFEIIDDKRSRLIEKIKNLIITVIYDKEKHIKGPLSDYLSASLNQEYSTLSKLFSDANGTTIEKYYILQKIERAKELLKYDELSISQISFDLGYSSVAHFSKQFKDITGLTPSYFKQAGDRTPIEHI